MAARLRESGWSMLRGGGSDWWCGLKNCVPGGRLPHWTGSGRVSLIALLSTEHLYLAMGRLTAGVTVERAAWYVAVVEREVREVENLQLAG